MPAKLESSSPIDRDGAGETPAVGSTYRVVQAIPRGSAWRYADGYGRWDFHGGRPRCPICLTSSRKRIAFNGYHSTLPDGDFHCRKCLVTWIDSIKYATCCVCEHYYTNTERTTGTCYHLNTIQHPFCSQCEAIIGADVKHCRRQLRRMVGLR